MRLAIAALAAAVASCLSGPALAWSDLGDEVAAAIAYEHLTPATKARVEALLAADKDALTAPDFASRGAWAGRVLAMHRAPAAWAFVDLELDQPDLNAACFGFPKLPPGQPASHGPAQDCAVNKIEQFSVELRDPSTPEAEKILALKFLVGLTAAEQQPLNASDHHDRHGECVRLDPPVGPARTLRAYWDAAAVAALGGDAPDIAARLNRAINPERASAWAADGPRRWALETFQVARLVAYRLPSAPTCAEHGSVSLSPAYQAQAQRMAAVQLEKAGIRIATMLNRTLGE